MPTVNFVNCWKPCRLIGSEGLRNGSKESGGYAARSNCERRRR